MAKKLKAGDVIHGYRVTKVFGPGMMAISYGALGSGGQKVFLKQYKSPAPTVVWYKPFVAYQKELSARVRNGTAAHFAVNQVDAFEEIWGGRCYFQAYEFVENGADLQHMLDEEREQHRRTKSAPMSDPSIWARHLTWAKVFMSGIAALHEARIVHADLKPANAYLIGDSTITAGYQLKLIDMDFSLLADRKAPWHGFQAYIGTDNYRSPEHLTRGAVPGLPSDIFTCGLMLYELLAGYHPYWQENQAEYVRLVRAYAAKPPALAGPMPGPANNAEVSSALHRCLSPDLGARPTATELRAILSGRGARSAAAPARDAGTPGVAAALVSPAATAAPPGITPVTSDRLELQGPDGHSLQIAVRTELGKALVRQFGPDGEFWDDRQCIIERSAARQWTVSPISGTINETLVNGESIAAPRARSTMATASLSVARPKGSLSCRSRSAGFDVSEPGESPAPEPDVSKEPRALDTRAKGPEPLENCSSPAEETSGLDADLRPGQAEALDQAGSTSPTEAAEAASRDTLETAALPPIPPVVDVQDLDWPALRKAVDPAAIRARIRPIVKAMESLLDRVGGPGMLFDADRADASEKAVRTSAPPYPPLWFIGDLHGDLLALEASLDVIRAGAGIGVPGPRIVFLGDLFDDEGFGLEVLLRVFELIVQEPQSICLIAGNHDEALSYDGVRFGSTVDPSDFADFLNGNLAHEWIERAGKLAVRLFAQAPRALFLPDGLLVAHGGFPLADLHPRLAEAGDWNDPACLEDFVWTRAHPTARKKLPNRYGRGSQFGYEDFAAFCAISTTLGWPVTHMVRGHDHVDERYAIYPAYRATPILTTIALSRRLSREGFGPFERAPSLARYVERAVPQVYRLHIPAELIREVYSPGEFTDGEAVPIEELEI